MYQLRGFVPINAFTDNAEGVIAPFGELSPLGRSFSREIKFNRVDESADVRLMTFDSDRDSKKVSVDVVYFTLVLNVAQWLFNKSISGDLAKDPTVVLQAVQAEFKARATILEIGDMLTNGRYWFPSSITMKALEADNEDNRLKVWFADDYFRRQYDLFTHVVAPPFDTLDDFFLPADTVITRLKAINSETTNTQNNKYRGDFPETALKTTNYDYVSPLDPKDTYPTPWSVFIYGLAGISADAIKDSLVAFILANSKHPQSDWEKIFPDLFTPTEFYIIPFWDRYSLPDNQLVAGFYSPTIPLSKQLTTGKKYAFGTDYTQAHLQANLTISGCLYRSMQFLSVGHPKNRHAPLSFDKLWPKYAMISSTSIDFGRMDPELREFILLLNKLLIAAEVATLYTEIPDGMTRVVRNGVIYMTAVYQKVQYVVAAKQKFVSV